MAQNAELLELLNRGIGFLEYLCEKACCAEMRQCQTTGEATDASRMTSNYLRAQSALWSTHTKQVILETVVTKGNLASIQYQGIFSEKDKRRSELLAAIFYQSLCKNDEVLYNAFSEQDESCDKLFKLLPSFRNELTEEAVKKGLEGIYEYEKKFKNAIGEIPGELQAIYDFILPVNKQFEPILPSASAQRAESAKTVNALSKKAKDFFKWAKTSGLSTSDNESENKTVAIVKYCWNLAELHKREYALNVHKYLVKRAEIPKETNAKKRDLDEKLLEGFLSCKFPKHAKINHDYAELKAEAAAKKNADEATKKSKE